MLTLCENTESLSPSGKERGREKEGVQGKTEGKREGNEGGKRQEEKRVGEEQRVQFYVHKILCICVCVL